MAQTMLHTGAPPAQPDPADRGSTRLLRLVGGAVTVAAAVVMIALTVVGGMPVSHAARAAIVVLVTQVLPGALAWRAVRPRRGWLLEDLAMGFAVGSALAIGAQVVAGLTQQPWLSYGPLVVAVVLMLVPSTRARILSARSRPLPWWWGPSVAATFLLMIFQLPGYFRSVPLTWTSGARAPHVDAYLHLALAGQLAHRGPTTFPWVQSESLGYHWFSHAWVAQVSVASGTGLDEVLFRFMPALMPLVVALSIATAAVRLTERSWTGPVAAVLALAGGDLNVFGKATVGLPIAPLSPSLGLSIPMLVGMVTVLATRWNGTMLRGGVLLVPVLGLAAAGSKGSTLPLVVAGLGLAFVAMLFVDRRRAVGVLGDLAIVVACLVVALIFVFHGSDAGLHFSPTDAVQQTGARSWLGRPDTRGHHLVIMSVVVGGILARASAAFLLPFARSTRRGPLPWFLIGGGLAGAGAVAVFAHPGWSQWYFARTAIPLLALGSAVGLAVVAGAVGTARLLGLAALGVVAGALLVSLGPAVAGPTVANDWRRTYLLIALAGLVLLAAGVVGWLGGRHAGERLRLGATAMVLTVLAAGVIATAWQLPARPPRQGLPNAPLTQSLATSRGQIDAARWIRDHSDINDLVMTNRHCTTPAEPVGCDTRRFVVAAFSERQVLVEGWTATPMSAKLGPRRRDSVTVSYWKPELLRLNDGFIASPTEDAARELRRLGVRWIFVDHTRPYAQTLEPYAVLRYQTPGVDVYEFAN